MHFAEKTKSPFNLKSQFTLLIPTYNRHETLKKLLRYFNAQPINFTIFVLDSSFPEVAEKNLNFISSLSINIQHIVYSNDTQPFHKFSDGFQRVTTPFSAMCADDDIIFVDAIEECVQFLLNNPDYSLAHGLYCDFWEHKNEVSIDRLIYSRSSLQNDNPVNRLCELMQNYEATTYAIHRTNSAQEAFKKAAPLQNILFQELLSSVLCVLQGKAARIFTFYSARNNERTNTYSLWHPLELVSTSPENLFNEYFPYRKAIFDSLSELKNTDTNIEHDTKNIIDLAHLCYLSPYLRPEILKFALHKHLQKEHHKEFSKNLWQQWAELHSGSSNKYFKWLHKLKSKLLPSFSFSYFIRRTMGKLQGDLTHDAILLATQQHRRYRVSKAFQQQMAAYNPTVQLDILNLIRLLNSYA